MLSKLEYAIQKRNEGDYETSINILVSLAEKFPSDALIHYQCATSMDVSGRETEAVPYYKKAISFGLSEEYLQNAYIGLGSTYRTLGKYDEAKKTLQDGMRVFPNNKALKVFNAMVLYNLQEHHEAMEVLLSLLVKTTNNQEIKDYKKAINYYSDKLDRVWN